MNIFFPGIFFCEIAHYEFPFQFHPQIPGIRFSIPLPVRNRPSHSCSRSQDQKDIPVHPCFQCWIKTTFPSVGTERVVRLILGSQRNFAITASASHQLFSCCRFSTAIWIYKILSSGNIYALTWLTHKVDAPMRYQACAIWPTIHSTKGATPKIYCTQDQETMHQRCIAQ